MRNYLTEHALKNIWCEPVQDRQYIIQPARYTSGGGALNVASIGWVGVPLPIQGTGSNARFFHVYQIGQMAPSLLNISDKPGTWFSAEGLMETYGVVIDAFLGNGAKIPPAYIWIQVTRDKNVLMAIQNVSGLNLGTVIDGNVRKARLNLDDIYVRFYSNQYFDSAEYTNRNTLRPKINVVSQFVRNVADFSSFWTQCSAVNNSYNPGNLGLPRYYVDGFEVVCQMQFDQARHANRMFTMVRDSSIKALVNFGKVTDLLTFTSQVDVGETKLILLNTTSAQIEFHDDIDFILTKNDVCSTTVRFPVTTGKEIRMLTNNAWALDVNRVLAVINDQAEIWSGLGDVQLGAYVRFGGMRFGLINEAQRLNELGKLTTAEQLGAMSGVSALVDVWRAENLEQSAYTEVMSASLETIDSNLSLVADAYGYNAASLLMSNPVKPIDSVNYVLSVEMPPAATTKVSNDGPGDRTIYTYDEAGKLVTVIASNGDYTPFLIPTIPGKVQRTAEVFALKHSTEFDGCYFQQTVEDLRLATQGFRVYACSAPGGVPSEIWSDVTEIGEGLYYTYNPNGTLLNNNTPTIDLEFTTLISTELYIAVKVGGYVTFITPVLSTGNYQGHIRFNVPTLHDGWLGGDVILPQRIAPGVVDVFMDGECLIEDIDYYVAWPEICVVRIPPRTPADGLKVSVRMHGFCNPDTMTTYPARETGFVRGGYLSVDGEYDIRNDRAIRVLVGGNMMRRSEVRFAEDDSGPVVTDGRPYSISDYQMPVEGYTDKHTIPWLTESRLTDDAVQAYLDIRKTENVPPQPFIIGNRWQLYSPFFSAILHAFNYGYLGAGQLNAPYESTDIATWVAPYLYLLAYDPCVKATDFDFIEIRPHQYTTPRTVSAAQFAFLHKINLQFLGGKVEMSPSIVIGA